MSRPTTHTEIRGREDLVSALEEAAQLEHALLLQYLYAAFSMKKRPDEGVTELQADQIRWWQRSVLTVAREEMAHLGTVCNLLIAVGATPWLVRPPFPSTSARFSPPDAEAEPARFTLAAFSAEAVERFVWFERPELELAAGEQRATVGALYREIQRAIAELDGGDGGLLVTRGQPEDVDVWGVSGTVRFGRITDVPSALRAIDAMIEQGEGGSLAGEDSHYARFRAVHAELQREQAAHHGFEPARPVLTDPPPYGPASPVDDPVAAEVGRSLDAVYELLIATLIRYYAQVGANQLRAGAERRLARRLMGAVLRPLAEILTELPAGPGAPGRTAGPAFGLTPGFASGGGSQQGIGARLAACARPLAELAPHAPRLAVVAENLRLAARLAERTLEP